MVSSPSIWLVFVISISCSFFLPKKKHVCFTVSLLTTRSVSAAPVAKDRKQKNCVILVHVVHAPRVRSICIDRSMSHMLERFIQSLITLNYSALRKISLGERKVINKTPQELLFIFFCSALFLSIQFHFIRVNEAEMHLLSIHKSVLVVLYADGGFRYSLLHTGESWYESSIQFKRFSFIFLGMRERSNLHF